MSRPARTIATITLGGTALLPDPSGALYWPAESALLVADLHLEKGSSFARRGIMLPPYDTHETLARPPGAIARRDPARVIALGDSFHDIGGAGRVNAGDLARLQSLQEGREWIWIAGNHDPHVSARAGGRQCASLRIGELVLRHEPSPDSAAREIAGHLHPAARVARNGASVRRPCFVGNGRRLVMPAFGAFTGGLNVLDAAFQPLFAGGDFGVWMLGAESLYPVATHRLRAD